MVLDGSVSTGFAVLDFETTGFSRNDKILEIGVVLLNSNAEPEKYWRTLVQPNCGFNNSDIHHIFPTDLVGAPTFEQVAQRFAGLLNERVLVAHNAPFERRFLESEFGRVGLQLPRHNWILDTQRLSRQLLPGAPMRLSSCLEVVGVDNLAAHTALADAVATSQLFAELLRMDSALLHTAEPLRFSTEQLRTLPESSVPLVARADGLFIEATADNVAGVGGAAAQVAGVHASDPFAAESEWLRRLTKSVPDTGDELSDRYFAFLAKAMVDGRLSEKELAQLRGVAAEYGLAQDDVSELHEHYLKQLVIEAWADGVLTNRERFWLGRIADELSIEQTRFRQLLARPSTSGIDATGAEAGPHDVFPLAKGDRVTFTGAMVTPRESWEARARKAGLDVGGVIKNSRVVVAADVHTMSGKAKKARRLGIAIIDEVTFARAFAALTASASVRGQNGSESGQASATSVRPVAPAVMPQAGELFDESNTIAPLETLSEVFPWLKDPEPVAPVRGDTVGIVEAWLAGHETEQLVDMSPYLNPLMRPESAPWERAMVLLGASRQSGITNISAWQLAKLPGIGRVRLQKLVSEVVLLALDEHETSALNNAEELANPASSTASLVQTGQSQDEPATDEYENFGSFGQLTVEESESVDTDVLLDWMALTGAGARIMQNHSDIPGSVVAAVQSLEERQDFVIRRACSEIADVVALDKRYAAIVDKRLAGKATLEDLGQQCGVTRERVRQLEALLRKALSDIGPSCDLVKAAIRARVGKAIRLAELRKELPALETAPAGLETELLALLPLVGTPDSFGVEFSDQWVTEREFAKAVETAVTSQADSFGVAALDEVAAMVGIESALAASWIEEQTPYVLREGRVFTRTGSVPERAAALLSVAGRPLTTDELSAIMTNRSSNSIDNALSVAENIHRCAPKTWALSDWGLEEWTTISDFIGSRLNRANVADPTRSTAVPLVQIIEEAKKLGIPEGSVRTFAATGDFIVESGSVRYRAADEVPVNNSIPEEAKGLYLRDGEWQLLLTVTKDHIRGSGTGIDRGIAALYDVPFGESVMIPSRLGQQRISWGKTNASLGTISRFVRDMGLVEGDRVWLHFGETFDITRAPAARTDAEGICQVVNRFGLDDDFLNCEGRMRDGITEEQVLSAINQSMNLPAGSSRRKTVRRLWERGEDELATLVREL